MREEGLTGKTSKKLEMEGMIEVGLRMKGGGMKKKKTKTENHWESLATENDVVLQDVMNKAKTEKIWWRRWRFWGSGNGRRCCSGDQVDG